VSTEKRNAFYTAIERSQREIFAVTFTTANPGLAFGVLAGRLEGFYRSNLDGKPPQIEV